MPVGLVLVSHVAELADGVRTLAAQMAPGVTIRAAGGTDDDSVGTSFDKVLAAVSAADDGGGVAILYDLGSAQMTAELVVEALDPDQAARVRLVDAPLVEGAVAAAVTAAAGADLDAVAMAAAGTTAQQATPPREPRPEEEEPEDRGRSEDGRRAEGRGRSEGAGITATAVLRNAAGLHARPAAEVVRLAGSLDVRVELGRLGGHPIDAASVLGLVALGLRGGDEIAVSASGPDAQRAVDAIIALVDAGFGELAGEPASALAGPQAVQEIGQEIAATGEPAPRPSTPTEPGVIRGTRGSPGMAIGPVRHLRRLDPVLPVRTDADPAAEADRLAAALGTVETDLTARAAVSGTAAGIAAAQLAMLADPLLREGAMSRIAAGTPAELAWWQGVQEARAMLADGDAFVAERAADVDDIGRAVLGALGADVRPTVPTEGLAGAVVVASDVLPSDVPGLADAGVAGLAAAGGGPTSHATLIARGLELPFVVRLGEEVLTVVDGSDVVLDGMEGVVRTEPAAADLAAARQRRDALADERVRLRSAAAGTVIKVGARRVRVSANVGTLAEARAAVDAGADGAGLLRTELLYIDREALPAEADQAAELSAMFQVLGGRPVVVRTLDAGGDKLLPALHLDAWRHGPLGERGLRYGLRHREVLRTQLRAVLRAAHNSPGEVSVMAPMVTLPAEARSFRELVDEVAAELDRQAVAHARPASVGVMVEVPAAALSAAEICTEVDFVSIGSNDLAQYVMAADRGNDAVGHLYDPGHPALWRLYQLVVSAGHAAGCRVAVCGEVSGDPEAARRLVDLGVDELSMAPAAVPVVKAALREVYGQP